MPGYDSDELDEFAVPFFGPDGSNGSFRDYDPVILENYNLTQEAEVDSDYRREFRSTLDQTKNKSFLNALSHLTNRQSKERSGKEKIGKQELVKERCKSPVDKEEEG